MPVYTNEHKLPLPFAIAAALEHSDYEFDPDVFRSATQLVSPTQLVLLQRQHWDEIKIDVSSLAYAVLGSAFHRLMERACEWADKEPPDHIRRIFEGLLGDEWREKLRSIGVSEKRLFDTIDIEPNHGPLDHYRISGQFDYMETNGGILLDYKLMSVWEWIYGLKDEKVNQLNVLAHLCRANGLDVKHLVILAMFRDWSKSRARTKPEGEYPPAQVLTLKVPLWLPNVAEEYVRERVALHARAEAGDVPECSSEERWARDEAWAVMKRGRKTAVKLFKVSDYHEASRSIAKNHSIIQPPASLCKFDADVWMKNQSDASNMYLEHRPGESVRCMDYCAVGQNGLCPQWESMKG